MTVKTNDRKRVVLPTAKPGDVFQVDVLQGGIMLTRLAPVEPKLVKPRRVKGRLMGAEEARPGRQEIVNAIRVDREVG